MTGRFELAIFDLDGVVADTAGAHYTAWKAIADELDAPFDESVNGTIKGVDRMGSLEAILGAAGLVLPEMDKRDAAARKNHIYLDTVASLGPDELLLPGAIALVEAMRGAGLSCAVASASRNAPLVLDRAGLAGLFDYVADPANNRPKPAPDLFLDCARALDVAPARCVAFEDSAAGLAAIRTAGMRAIGIGADDLLDLADQLYPSTSGVDPARVLGA